MIYTNRKVTVRNGVSTIDSPIILYRGDKEIDIKFEIIDIQFKFRGNNGNLIDNTKASFGQLAIQNPDGNDTFTDIAACEDGQVVFRITGEMIDEIYEVGMYSFHIRLFDEDQTSRITIPQVIEGIEIREPLVIEDDNYSTIAMVDYGEVDETIITNDTATFLDENGQLNIEWKKGDIISSVRLNQMVKYINDNAVAGEGSTVDLSGLGADLSLNGQTLKLKNSNGVEIGTGVTLPQTSGVSFRDIIADEIFNVFTIDDGGSETNIAVKGITINTHTLNIKIDEIISLHATINPNNAKNKNVIWATTNSNVEITPSGLNCSVKGINSGSCKITVTTEDGGYTDSCDIVVTDQQVTDIITDGLLIDLDLRNLDGVTTTISDNSGNGNDFTMTKAVASIENSWQPGSDSSGAYCNNLITASDYTVELYVKLNTDHNQPYINLGKINWSSTIEGFKITPYNNSNNSPLAIVGSKAAKNYYPNFDMVDSVLANSFYHVVFTKQNLAVNVYIDGELKLSGTLTHDITMNNAPIAINGGCEDNLGTGFPNKTNKAACYKMFRLYNKALTAEEVKSNYDIEVTK